jgi:hypothetical protein
MADFLREKTIKYLNKDFEGFRRDLLKYSEAHHSGVFQDTNESSPGMMLLEWNAYIGDVLAYYIDQSFREIKQETARQEKNVVAFAKSLGYRPRGPRAARGTVHFIVEVPATTGPNGQTVPDDAYSPVLLRGAKSGATNGTVFETLENVHFSASFERDVTGSQFDSNGVPTHFALRKPVEVIAGETKVDSVLTGDFQQFKTIELSEQNVIEIISVTDSEGNEWTEVDYLAQEVVFDSVTNSDPDATEVPYILKLLTVPRRFIADRNPTTNKTSLIFGSGDGIEFDDELIPNLADYALPLAGRRTFTSFALDPQNFLRTRSLGLSPFGTTLTITYRVGGGSNTNVPAKSIRDVTEADLDFSSNSLDPAKVSAVEGSLECINIRKTEGGGPRETISEIKANGAAFFASQNRVVTKEDFISRVLTLPEKFGKPEKVFVKRNNVNALALDMHVLARDEAGHLARASANLKKNIKTYLSQFRMLTDGINILDGNVVNLKLNFGVVVASKMNRTEVLSKAIAVIIDYLDTNRQQIGQPIVLSDLSAEIQNVLGVVSVYELRFSNLVGLQDGLSYSDARFDVTANTQNNIIYCPDNSIFEVKFPRRDIVGVAK